MNPYQLNKLVEVAHKTAVEKGFHDKPLNVGEKVALIVGELGEALEAFRIGHIMSDDVGLFHMVDKSRFSVKEECPIEDYAAWFGAHVKDTLQDELADVCVRLFDLAGALRFELAPLDDEAVLANSYTWSSKNITEDIAKLMVSGVNIYAVHNRTGLIPFFGEVLKRSNTKSAMNKFLHDLQVFCFEHDIDIEDHIYGKMVFNKTRERLHGNKRF